ncbi:MAG: c-type cytochrome [Bauldia sp.]|nr:c-type cytochrome [Bauldia sp.]
MPGLMVRSGAAATPARRPKWLAAFVVLPLAFLVAACGESGEGDAPTPPAPIPDTAPLPPVAAAPETVPVAPVATPPPLADPVPIPVAEAPSAAATPPAPVAAPTPAPEPTPVAPEPTPAPAPEPAPAAAPEPLPVAPPPAAPVAPAAGARFAEADPALAARLAAADPNAGRLVAARCGTCHAFEAGAAPGVGPSLYDVVGAPVAAVPGFAYSPAFTALAATGAIWTVDRLDAFLASPAVAVPGTRMGFGGLPDEVERANLIAYLRILSDAPLPLPDEPAADPFRAEIIALGLRPVAFTAEQVQIGRDYYRRYCATCHGLSFEGIFYGMEWGEAPPLAGDRFERRWFVRSLADFVTTMEETDILNYASLHQGLSPDRYVAVAAFLLQQYGFAAGEVPLPVEPEALRGIGFWQ